MKDVTLVFGQDGDCKFREYPIGNTLIVGRPGSGMQKQVSNIVNSLLLRYTSHDMELMVFDYGQGLFSKDSSLSKADICSEVQVIDGGHENILFFSVGTRFMAREHGFESSEKPLIIVVCGAPARCSCKVVGWLNSVLGKCRKYNMYFILQCTEHPAVYTDFDIDLVEYVVKHIPQSQYTDEQLEYSKDRTYSVAEVSHGEESHLVTVPFFTQRKIRDVCTGSIAPFGVTFDSYNLREFAIANGCEDE